MLCLESEGNFVFNDKCFHFCAGDILILTLPDRLKNLGASPNLKVEYFAAPYNFLNNQLPSNSFAIGGGISLYADPVVHATTHEAQLFLADIRLLSDRMKEAGSHLFFQEMIGSICRLMMYDLFSIHARRNQAQHSTDRRSHVVKELISLLAAGRCRTERTVEYYARELNVSPKYLSKVVKRTTGTNVFSFIDRYTVPILKDYLNDSRLSLTQIADAMNFNSLSYFSRYCTKHLGISPSEYRASLQPQGRQS